MTNPTLENGGATAKPPLEWIKLELLPLPHCQDQFFTQLLWWNPNERQLIGESADIILEMVKSAFDCGQVKALDQQFEINDPLGDPTEFAAILAQYFWVLPEPVAEPEIEKIKQQIQ